MDLATVILGMLKKLLSKKGKKLFHMVTTMLIQSHNTRHAEDNLNENFSVENKEIPTGYICIYFLNKTFDWLNVFLLS